MSFSKNRKRSGVILAGVTTASVAASAASQGMVRALPQGNATTSLLNNVSREGVKNSSSILGNFLKNNYGWVIGVAVVIVVAAVFLTGGGEKKEEHGQGGESLPKENKVNKAKNVPEIDNNIKNENELDFKNKASKINKKEPSLLDVILSKMEEINSAESKIEDKEEARGDFLKNYKLGSFFHTFFKKGRKIGDIKFDKEKGKLFYEDENKSAVILFLGEYDTNGVKLEKEILEKYHYKEYKTFQAKKENEKKERKDNIGIVKEIDTVKEILERIEEGKDVEEIAKQYDLGGDFKVFLPQLTGDSPSTKGVWVDKGSGEEGYNGYCVHYWNADLDDVRIASHQKDKNKGGIELEKKIFKALLPEETANFFLKKNEEQDLKDKNKEKEKLIIPGVNNNIINNVQ